MNPGIPKSKLNTQIYEEACDWLVHFRAGDADNDIVARQQLDEWLRRSPEHVRAYLEVSAIWEDIPLHDSDRKINADDHIARALSESNVYPLEPANPGEARAPKARSSRLPLTLAACALLTLSAASAWFITERNIYRTAIGEQRTLTLDDGSTVELNARSKMKVQFTEAERHVDLLEGQALFRVTKDANRPFVVASHDIRVRAIGTQFDVNRRTAATTVTVIEGRVGVVPNASDTAIVPKQQLADAPAPPANRPAPHEVVLDAGEQLVVAPKHAVEPAPANITAATAWTQQRLIFDSSPLSEVVEEFNRYNKRPMVIQDRALDSFRVIGVFSSSDPTSFIAFLRAQPDMTVTEESSAIYISRK